ncbi:hypothetical protein SynRCC2555_01123 [Synechococcus sp. WH 8101]|nr:hypothetical protein SynRCC2555_01123 [Synechococcus sp. WH 8101]
MCKITDNRAADDARNNPGTTQSWSIELAILDAASAGRCDRCVLIWRW